MSEEEAYWAEKRERERGEFERQEQRRKDSSRRIRIGAVAVAAAVAVGVGIYMANKPTEDEIFQDKLTCAYAGPSLTKGPTTGIPCTELRSNY